MANPELRSMWLGEVKDMAGRIISMRAQLRDGLAANGESKELIKQNMISQNN